MKVPFKPMNSTQRRRGEGRREANLCPRGGGVGGELLPQPPPRANRLQACNSRCPESFAECWPRTVTDTCAQQGVPGPRRACPFPAGGLRIW